MDGTVYPIMITQKEAKGKTPLWKKEAVMDLRRMPTPGFTPSRLTR